MRDDPGMRIGNTNPLGDVAQGSGDILSFGEAGWAQMLKLIPRINHDAELVAGATVLCRGLEQRVVVFVGRFEPHEMLVDPVERFANLTLCHALGWAAAEGLADVLLGELGDVELDREVFWRVERERPSPGARHVNKQGIHHSDFPIPGTPETSVHCLGATV